MPPAAVLQDKAGQPMWTIRVAPMAHEIAVDCSGCGPPPSDRVYQLWLASTHSPLSLGLMPASGRKIIAELPWLFSRLAGDGELLVSLEQARGSDRLGPKGPILFRTRFPADDGADPLK